MSRRFQRYFVQERLFDTIVGSGNDAASHSLSRFSGNRLLLDLLESDL